MLAMDTMFAMAQAMWSPCLAVLPTYMASPSRVICWLVMLFGTMVISAWVVVALLGVSDGRPVASWAAVVLVVGMVQAAVFSVWVSHQARSASLDQRRAPATRMAGGVGLPAERLLNRVRGEIC